jgi:peptide/nickel transport system substrate-binding protein
MAETPADTLVMAKQIDDLISFGPAEGYERRYRNPCQQLRPHHAVQPTDINTLVGGVAESVTVGDDGKFLTFKSVPAKFASGNQSPRRTLLSRCSG